MSAPERHGSTFSLSAGGLVTLLQFWVRGPESRAFPVPLQILVAVSVLWLPLAALSLAEGSFAGAGVAQPFIADIVPNVRFLIATPLLLLADRTIDPVVHVTVGRLRESGIVQAAHLPKLLAAETTLRRTRDSVLPDVTILALAFGITWLFKPGYDDSAIDNVATSWLWSLRDGGEVRYSVAGWWYLLVSGPMFQVILFRWFWRFLIWSAFLYRVAGLGLVLRPSHPDLAGGLGFLGTAQQAFVAVFFAFATVCSSTFAHDIMVAGETVVHASFEVVLLVLVFVAIIYGPLLFFCRQVFVARRSALNDYGALGYRLAEAFDQKWFGGARRDTGPALLSSTDPSAMADYTAAYGNVRAMRPVPVSIRILLMSGGILLVPFLPLALIEFSLQDLFQRLVDTLV